MEVETKIEMREIKFRAWDLIQKHFLNWDIVQHEHFSGVFDEEFVFQQYTGLKDKNGKEIYEGDLVRHLFNINHFQVEWFRSAWRYNRIFLLHEISPVEVIGNIYQNPELIKS